jgi:two-component system, OmpR family, response regulator
MGAFVLRFFLVDMDGSFPETLRAGMRGSGYPLSDWPGTGPDHPGPRDGLVICGGGGLEGRVTRAREDGFCGVLITLRARRDPELTARLLHLGADDDLVLPVTATELGLRAQSILRAHGRAGADPVAAPYGIRIFSDDRVPEFDGAPLPLSGPQGRILTQLLRQMGRPVLRETLLAVLNAEFDAPALSRAVDVHICHIRGKLKRAIGAHAPRIETIRGIGYRIPPPV